MYIRSTRICINHRIIEELCSIKRSGKNLKSVKLFKFERNERAAFEETKRKQRSQIGWLRT